MTIISSIVLSVQVMLNFNYEFGDLFSNFLILISTNYCHNVWRAPGLTLLFSFQLHSIWIPITVMDQNFLPVLKSFFLYIYSEYILILYLWGELISFKYTTLHLFLLIPSHLIQTTLLFLSISLNSQITWYLTFLLSFVKIIYIPK